jgi:hypothetical protein
LLSLDVKHVLKPFVCDLVSTISYNSDEMNAMGEFDLINSGYYAYNIFTKWGLMGPDGKPITKALYNKIEGLSKTHFLCEIESFNVIVDTKGRESP